LSKVVVDIKEFQEEFDDGNEEESKYFIAHLVGGVQLKIEAVSYEKVDDGMIDFCDENNDIVASLNKDYVVCIHIEECVVITKGAEEKEEV